MALTALRPYAMADTTVVEVPGSGDYEESVDVTGLDGLSMVGCGAANNSRPRILSDAGGRGVERLVPGLAPPVLVPRRRMISHHC